MPGTWGTLDGPQTWMLDDDLFRRTCALVHDVTGLSFTESSRYFLERRLEGRMSALGGGVADKLGNRCEGWWTIWRGVVPVLRGEYDAITVEAVGAPVRRRSSGSLVGNPPDRIRCTSASGATRRGGR